METYTMRGTKIAVQAALVGDDDIDEIANWCGGQVVEEKDALSGETVEGLNVKTPTGRKRASAGDYVVKHGNSFQVFTESQLLAKFNLGVPLSEQVKEQKNWRHPINPLTQDPFEGMTRFNDGPKP